MFYPNLIFFIIVCINKCQPEEGVVILICVEDMSGHSYTNRNALIYLGIDKISCYLLNFSK